MVRKQLYLAAEQDRKLKRLARARRSTEAAVVRDAIDAVPEPTEDDWLERLQAEGFFAPKRELPTELRDVDPEELLQDLLRKLAGRQIGLGQAVLEERADSLY